MKTPPLRSSPPKMIEKIADLKDLEKYSKWRLSLDIIHEKLIKFHYLINVSCFCIFLFNLSPLVNASIVT